MMMSPDIVLTTANAKGKRLQRLRNISNLSRKALIEKTGLNPHTLRGWENGLATGLSKPGAKKVIEAVAAEGVLCSFDWLMYGIGSGPRLIDQSNLNSTPDEIQLTRDKEEKHIIKELECFRQISPQTIDFIVNDDGLFPFYHIGDYVAGIKRYGKKINTVVGLDCIVQTTDGKVLLRKVRETKEKNKYDLICTNANTKLEHPVLYNVELISAAPVIWVRRRDV